MIWLNWRVFTKLKLILWFPLWYENHCNIEKQNYLFVLKGKSKSKINLYLEVLFIVLIHEVNQIVQCLKYFWERKLLYEWLLTFLWQVSNKNPGKTSWLSWYGTEPQWVGKCTLFSRIISICMNVHSAEKKISHFVLQSIFFIKGLIKIYLEAMTGEGYEWKEFHCDICVPWLLWKRKWY